jgi:hypothetical protein
MPEAITGGPTEDGRHVALAGTTHRRPWRRPCTQRISQDYAASGQGSVHADGVAVWTPHHAILDAGARCRRPGRAGRSQAAVQQDTCPKGSSFV